MGHIEHVALLVNLKPAIEKNIWFSFCVPIGKDFKKSVLPTFLHFVRLRAAHQPHVSNLVELSKFTLVLLASNVLFEASNK